jgi:fatty acid-binding protein DegV
LRPDAEAIAVGEVGAAIGVHVGPGTLAVTVRRG